MIPPRILTVTVYHSEIKKSTNIVESVHSCVFCGVAQHLLDPEELVVFGDTVGPGSGSGLDLAGVESDDDIGYGSVFGLAASVGYHCRVSDRKSVV